MKRLAIAVGLAVAACAPSGPPVVATAQLTPLNQAAAAIGTPHVEYVTAGTGTGQVKVTMPDGEILNGHFALAAQGGFVTGENSALGPTGIIDTGGTSFVTSSDSNIWVSAAGPKTRLRCNAQLGAGHGEGVCETASGAVYRLVY